MVSLSGGYAGAIDTQKLLVLGFYKIEINDAIQRFELYDIVLAARL